MILHKPIYRAIHFIIFIIDYYLLETYIVPNQTLWRAKLASRLYFGQPCSTVYSAVLCMSLFLPSYQLTTTIQRQMSVT